MKKITILAVALIAIIGGLLYNKKPNDTTTNTQQTSASSDIVSKKGIHWHPNLAIYIKGQKQVIPADIGIGKQYASSKWYDSMMSMTDFHTHDNSGELHWEVMEGPVTKDHVKLKAFLKSGVSRLIQLRFWTPKMGQRAVLKCLLMINPILSLKTIK